MCLGPAHNPNGYVSFGRWLAVNAPQLSTLQRKQISQQISEVKHICDDWDQIVANLSDIRMTHVDARRFTINKFYRACNMDWCLAQQRLNNPPQRDNPITPEFDSIKFNIAMESIRDILQDVSFCPEQGNVLSKMISNEIKKMCN